MADEVEIREFGPSPLREMLNVAWLVDQQRKWVMAAFPLPVEEPCEQPQSYYDAKQQQQEVFGLLAPPAEMAENGGRNGADLTIP